MPILGDPNTDPLRALLAGLVIVIAQGVMAYSILDLYKPERRVSGGGKTAWLLVILFIGMLVIGGSALLISSALNTTPLLALTPILPIMLYLGVVAFAIVDLYKPERRVRGGDKGTWLLVILFFGVFGWLAYFFIGREV